MPVQTGLMVMGVLFVEVLSTMQLTVQTDIAAVKMTVRMSMHMMKSMSFANANVLGLISSLVVSTGGIRKVVQCVTNVAPDIIYRTNAMAVVMLAMARTKGA